MAFTISPGVSVTETDLSTVIANVSASNGATVMQAQWGPVEQVTYIDTEEQLTSTFGKPTATVYEDFMCAASFLAYATNLQIVRVVEASALNASMSASVGTSGLLIKNRDVYSEHDFSASTDLFIAKYPGVLGNSLTVAWADTTGFDAVDTNGSPVWPYHDLFTDAPETDEFHIVIIDSDGAITGTADTILEKFAFVSTSETATDFDGSSKYVNVVLRDKSEWIYVAKTTLLSGSSNGVTMDGGDDGSAIGEAERATGWAIFASEEYDISLAFVGGASTTAAKNVIDNIAEYRKDCLAFVSPAKADVVNVAPSTALANIVSTRTTLGSSSYAVMDSNYKLMFDRYNNVNRWVPLNGDIAGLCARSTNENDAWWSPAGYDRGRIKNAIKLAMDQSQSIRDALYNAGVNPCVVFKNQGPMLYGDKTLQTKPSGFDQIGIRRLFIVIEKAIANAAKYQLFNFNDAITQAKFVNMVEPFLASIKGRRGIDRFKVICDDTNNTDQVKSSKQFVASIFILPVYSINFIQLNFVNTNSGTMFDELIVRS
jgi:hypothetical protein